jgi:multidrug transporter EmrE-like cation transporter
MNAVTFAMIVSGVTLNAVAQLCLKAGARAVGVLGAGGMSVLDFSLGAATNLYILIGLACYVLSFGIWVGALSRVDVSIAYPMLSLGYVINALAAWQLFGEALTAQRVTGIGVILVGVYILLRS